MGNEYRWIQKRTSKVIKPNFRRAATHEQKAGKEQKTKKQLLEEIEAIRQRLIELEYFASGEKEQDILRTTNLTISLQEEIDKRTKAEKAAEESKNLLHLDFQSFDQLYLSPFR